MGRLGTPRALTGGGRPGSLSVSLAPFPSYGGTARRCPPTPPLSTTGGTMVARRTVAATAAVSALRTTSTLAQAAPSAAAAGVQVCAGLVGCRVVAHADVNGDGARDAIALARRGGALGSRGVVIVRVKTGRHRVGTVRRPLENWSGSPWQGAAVLDGRRGKDLVIGRVMGASAEFFQSLTWRHGHLVTLDAPGPDRWWGLGRSATVSGGWLRRAEDPAGTVRQRVATQQGTTAGGPFRGRVTTWRWTVAGWAKAAQKTVFPLSAARARRWSGFHVPGLSRF